VQAILSYYYKVGTVIFAGDLNAQLDTETHLPPNQKSKLLSTFIKNNNLSPLHSHFNSNAYTYVTARSRIDHVLVERTSTHLFTKYSVANPHDIITSDNYHYISPFTTQVKGNTTPLSPMFLKT